MIFLKVFYVGSGCVSHHRWSWVWGVRIWKNFWDRPDTHQSPSDFRKKYHFLQKIGVSGFGCPGWQGCATDTFQVSIFLFSLPSSTRIWKQNFDRLSLWTSMEPKAKSLKKIFASWRSSPWWSSRPLMDMLLVSIERSWRPLSKNQLPDPIGPCTPEISAKNQIHLSKVSIGANVWEALPPDRVIGGMSLRCQFVRI